MSDMWTKRSELKALVRSKTLTELTPAEADVFHHHKHDTYRVNKLTAHNPGPERVKYEFEEFLELEHTPTMFEAELDYTSGWAWSGFLPSKVKGWALYCNWFGNPHNDNCSNDCKMQHGWAKRGCEAIAWFEYEHDAIRALQRRKMYHGDLQAMWVWGSNSNKAYAEIEKPLAIYHLKREVQVVEYHNNVHYPDCTSDCEMQHGWIPIDNDTLVPNIDATYLRDDGKCDSDRV